MNAIEHFRDFIENCRSACDRAGPVAGDALGFRKGVELQDIIAPVGRAEQTMRRAVIGGKEIAIGFVNDEPEPALSAECSEFGDGFGGIDCAGRVVRRDEDNCAGGRGDQLFRFGT